MDICTEAGSQIYFTFHQIYLCMHSSMHNCDYASIIVHARLASLLQCNIRVQFIVFGGKAWSTLLFIFATLHLCRHSLLLSPAINTKQYQMAEDWTYKFSLLFYHCFNPIYGKPNLTIMAPKNTGFGSFDASSICMVHFRSNSAW